jgi:hypothetical protein
VVLGDLNAFLSYEDKCGGANPNYTSVEDFKNCLRNANLVVLNSVGVGLRGKKKVRLDWALCNQEWLSTFTHSKAFHLLRFGSDHRPLLVGDSLSSAQWGRDAKSFKCKSAFFLEGFV